jgi:hypothetical protein
VISPLLTRITIVLVLVGSFIGAGWYVKAQLESARRAEAAAKEEVRTLNVRLAWAEVSARVVTQYVETVREVRVRGETIIKEIPVYVTAEADARCTVPVGFVRVHDAAASNTPLAGTASPADAGASGVALSAVAATVTNNYTTCHEIREQLIGLQNWIEEVRR